MGKYHEIDAPDITLESSPIGDNSELSFLYPDPARDTRPLLKSDAERHKQQQERLNQSVVRVLPHGFAIALFLAVPFIYAAVLGSFAIELATAQAIGPLVAVMIIGGFFWVGVLIACLKNATERLHRFGISGLSVGLVTIATLFIGGALLIPFAGITSSLVLNSYIFSVFLALISIATVYILLAIAITSYRRTSGQN